MLKRERATLERRLAELHPEGWEDKVRLASSPPSALPIAHSSAGAFILNTHYMVAQVDNTLRASAAHAFATPLRPAANAPGRVFAADFGARKMARERA